MKERRSIHQNERKLAMERAFAILQHHSLFKDSHDIACYFAQDDEFSCSQLIQSIWDNQKNCFLPVLSKEKFLEFVQYRPTDRLQPNQYHILEPVHTDKILPSRLDLVLMPLVGFDLQGNRLGMGGGYYDRTFQSAAQYPTKKPFLLGLAYEVQKVAALPMDPWDVRMDGVLTEENLYIFR